MPTRGSKTPVTEPKTKKAKVAPAAVATEKKATRGRPATTKRTNNNASSSSEDEDLVVQSTKTIEAKKDVVETNGESLSEMEIDEPPTKASKKDEKETVANGASLKDVSSFASVLTETSYMPGDMTTITHNGEATGGELLLKPREPATPGFVLAVGENLSNQLGLGLDVDNRKKPQLVKQLPSNIIQIASGGMHSAALSEGGTVSPLLPS